MTLTGPSPSTDDKADRRDLPGDRRRLAPTRDDHLHRDLHRHPGRPRRGHGHQHRHRDGTRHGGTVDPDDRHAPRSPRPRRPALTLVKTRHADDPYTAVGDVIAYSYLVTNTGNVTLTGRHRQPTTSVTVEPARHATTPRPERDDHLHRHLHRHPGRPRRRHGHQHRHRRRHPGRWHARPRRPTAPSSPRPRAPPSPSPRVGTTDVRPPPRRRRPRLQLPRHQHRQRHADGTVTVTDDNDRRHRDLPVDDRSPRRASITCTAIHTVTQADIDAGGA